MNTLVTQTLATSREADKYHANRTRYSILAAVTSEVGELAEEVAIAQGDSYKSAGPDGVSGEGVDMIIAGLDLLYKDNPDITEEQLMKIAAPKLAKWIDKIKERAEKET